MEEVVDAHRQYFTEGGEHVPSVTTVLKVIGNDFLVRWAGRLGLQGIDPEVVAQRSAAAGTLTHAAIAAHFGAAELTDEFRSTFTDEQKAGARIAWGNFEKWKERHVIQPILVEQWLVSEQWRYGGTMDLYALVDGRYTVVDFKTSNNVYESHLIQLAAYRALLEEHGHPVDEVRVVALPREHRRSVVEGVEQETAGALAVFIAALNLWGVRRAMTMPPLTRLRE